MNTVGLMRRFACLFYDSLLVLGLLMIAITPVVVSFEIDSEQHPLRPVLHVYMLLVTFLFFAWFWTRDGQTLGMQTWRVKVIDLQTGGKISWRQAAIRFFSGFTYVLFLGMAYYGLNHGQMAYSAISLAALTGMIGFTVLDKEHLLLNDKLSNTRLVSIPKGSK